MTAVKSDSGTATKEDMNELHALLAKEFSKVLTKGTLAVTDEGKTVVLPPTSAQLNVIRQFLKDNSIQSALTSKRMRGIVENLPFGDEDLPPNASRIYG